MLEFEDTRIQMTVIAKGIFLDTGYLATSLEERATRNSVPGLGNTQFAVPVAVMRLEYVITRNVRARDTGGCRRRRSREQ